MNKLIQKKTLLVLASTYPRWQDDCEPGFVHELSKRLTSSFNVIVVCPHTSDSKSHEMMDDVEVHRYRYAPKTLETLVNNGGIVTNLKMSPWKFFLLPGFFLSQLFLVRKLIKNNHIDVMHAHWLIPQGLVLALLSYIMKLPPFLVTSHGADLFALKGQLFNYLKRLVTTKASQLTVVSEIMKTTLIELGVDSKKISVMPMGVDMEHFKPSDEVQRSKHELLFVGRLVEKKGLCYLISAMPEILSTFPDVFLTVIGFGPEEQKLKEQVTKLNIQHKVNFLGAIKQEELVTYYQRAALFVAPFVEAESGDQEGLGLVLVEALACGCPLVVSDIPACRDVIREYSNLCIFTSGNINELRESVLFKLTNNKMFNKNNEYPEQKYNVFSWGNVSTKYCNLLLELSKIR